MIFEVFAGLYHWFLFLICENPSKSREADFHKKLSRDLAKLITQSVVVKKVGDEYKLELKTDKKGPCRDWSKAP